jgi:hypothetical protein
VYKVWPQVYSFQHIGFCLFYALKKSFPAGFLKGYSVKTLALTGSAERFTPLEYYRQHPEAGEKEWCSWSAVLLEYYRHHPDAGQKTLISLQHYL